MITGSKRRLAGRGEESERRGSEEKGKYQSMCQEWVRRMWRWKAEREERKEETVKKEEGKTSNTEIGV